MSNRNSHELLTKAQVIREYRYPKSQLDMDLNAGKIGYFRNEQRGWGRLYIARKDVERRIEELTAQEAAS